MAAQSAGMVRTGYDPTEAEIAPSSSTPPALSERTSTLISPACHSARQSPRVVTDRSRRAEAKATTKKSHTAG
jgi:hypothetical protein